MKVLDEEFISRTVLLCQFSAAHICPGLISAPMKDLQVADRHCNKWCFLKEHSCL